jgi:BAI1-associated protein 3
MESGQIPGTSLNHFTVLDGREPVDTRPFELYLALQEFSSLKQHLSMIPVPPEKPLGMQNFHLWFEPFIQRWISVSKAKAVQVSSLEVALKINISINQSIPFKKQRVRCSISLDQICEGEKIVRHSTSAVDTASCIYQLKEFWKLLAWPDMNSGLHYEAQLIEAATSTAQHYMELIHQALTDSGYYENQGPFRLSDDFCVTVNNLEYVRRALSEFHTEDLGRQELEAMLDKTLIQTEKIIERVLIHVCIMMHSPLQKAVFHLAWSPDSLPANQAIVPLLEYLDCHLSSLNSALLTKNFHRALNLIWLAVLSELSHQMDSAGEKPTNFHDRLYEALRLLVDFIHAEGLGLTHEVIKNDDYWRVEQRLQYHKTDTDRLVDLFYIQRLQEQIQLQSTMTSAPYGILAVRAYFNHDSLCVEVLHAKDVIPLDPNGFSDPFVIIELLPRRVFSHCNEQQTNVHKVSLNFLLH